MLNSPEAVLSSWLSKLSIKVSEKLIKHQLHSHPHYPSLLSLTDTLDYLKIKNMAGETEKDYLHNLQVPFLAHLKTNGGEFVIVENLETLEKKNPGFYSSWSGVVVTIKKDDIGHHQENENLLKTEQKLKREKLFVVTALVALGIASLFWKDNLIHALLMVLASTGVFVSSLIALQELGIASELVDKVCGKTESCNTIIQSKSIKLPFNLSLGDLSLIWFSTLLITLILSAWTGVINITDAIFWISLLLLPVTFFSIYYQWRIVKKWCRLCLITIALLWTQFSLSWSLTQTFWPSVDLSSFLFIASVLLFTAIPWLTVKSLSGENRNVQEQLWEASRSKKNEEIFNALLSQQKTVDVTPWEQDLQLGNPNAQLQLMVACNPYCNPCAVTHEKLNDLLELYQDKIGVTIRFSIRVTNPSNQHASAVDHILQHILQFTASKSNAQKVNYIRDVLHHWFQVMDLKKFVNQFPVTSTIDVTPILAKHELWTSKSEITFTPTIFINGKQLPSLYTVQDLNALINGMLDTEESEISISQNMAIA